MDFQDCTTEQIIKELASRYQHFGFVGIPKNTSDPNWFGSTNKQMISRLMVRYIVNPGTVTTLLGSVSGGMHGLKLNVPKAPTMQRAAALVEGLSQIYSEMIFVGNTRDESEPTILAAPGPQQATDEQKARLRALKDKIVSVPI